VLVALTGCADRLVDVPTARPTATVVMLDDSGHCPSDTVLLGDDDPAGGAGTIPAGFGGRLVLRCDVDYSTTTVQHGVERFTVRQWEHPLTPQLQTAFALPDRGFHRGGSACGAASAGTTALYVVDRGGRAVRILPPTQEPCHRIRDEVKALLPGTGSPAAKTFHAEQAVR
jgi:hypothetical protein